ncbi:MAG: tetratricopeptide repeat protein [Deltaproteobacteria bacterium]|nr:tetratricopeptide repeat protein [Deltaproteobacteria bacterium]
MSRPPWTAVAVAVIVIAGTAVFANSLPNAFHFDDSHAVVENPWIRSFRHLPRWFTDVSSFTVLRENQNYRPVLLATYALNYALGGLRPVAFRWFNLAGHLASAVLVLLLVLELLRRTGLAAGAAPPAGASGAPRPGDAVWVAFLAGAIFALNPLQSEIVNYVSSRSDGLCAFLYLLAFYLWVRANAAARPGRAIALRLGAVAAFAAGLLVKEVAITLPATLWLWEVLIERQAGIRLGWRRCAAYAALGAVAIAYLVLRAHLLRGYDIRYRSVTPPLEYFYTQLHAWFYYVRLFVVPVGLCVDPEYPLSRTFLEPRVVMAVVGFVGVVGLCWWLRRRRPEVTFALGFFWLTLLPTSSFLPIAEAVNEHRPYLGNAGLCLLAALLLGAVLPRLLGAKVARGAAVAVLVLLAALTVMRNRVWHDDLSLWQDVVRQAPRSGRAHLNHGLALLGRGRTDEALAEYNECARHWPGYSYCYINRSIIYRERGEWTRALADLKIAERLTPTLFWVPFYQGVTQDAMGQPGAAAAAFARTLAISPGFADARYRRAQALQKLGRTGEARDEAARAAALGHRPAARLQAELATP